MTLCRHLLLEVGSHFFSKELDGLQRLTIATQGETGNDEFRTPGISILSNLLDDLIRRSNNDRSAGRSTSVLLEPRFIGTQEGEGLRRSQNGQRITIDVLTVLIEHGRQSNEVVNRRPRIPAIRKLGRYRHGSLCPLHAEQDW